MTEHMLPPHLELSDKQREVLDLVVARKSSKEIARILNISKPTVDQRITSARAKFGAANRNELVTYYLASSQLCDRVTYDPAYLPDPGPTGAPTGQEAIKGPVFSVADVAGFSPCYPPADFSPVTHPLETLDKKFGVMGRLGAVGILSALLAVSLLAVLSMAQTLTILL
jgi:DNA-binding CsgD family transcriptional regulator